MILNAQSKKFRDNGNVAIGKEMITMAAADGRWGVTKFQPREIGGGRKFKYAFDRRGHKIRQVNCAQFVSPPSR